MLEVRTDTVNFYRSSYYDELNRRIVELCRAGDRKSLRDYIRQQDDAHPELYADEHVENRPGMQLITELVQALPQPLAIVDVACGSADLLKRLQRAGHQVAGVDVSPVRVALHRRDIPSLHEGFAEELPLASDSADVVIALECLEHVMDLDRSLREIDRVLRPGGAVLVTVPLGDAADGPNHVRHFTPQSLRQAFEKRGFHVLLTSRIPYLQGEPENNIFLAAVKLRDERTSLVITHALNYRLLKLMEPDIMAVSGIELTNLCNLRCRQCPTPFTGAATGYADDQTVARALDYAAPGQLFSYHRLGEPLLHPKLIQYVQWASDRGIHPLISTNGVLLTEEIFQQLLDAGLRNLQITLHTTASTKAYGMVARHLLAHPDLLARLTYVGNVLSHYDKVPEWLDSCGVSQDERRWLRYVKTHNWAGNVPGQRVAFPDDVVQRRVANCYFIKNNQASVRWDGTIVACCFDSENENVIGRLDDFTSLRHRPADYGLCRYCDPNWANGG
jgi:SAM-dependent methyltransferase